MRTRPTKYKITIENQSRLTRVAELRLSALSAWLFFLACVCVGIALAAVVIMATPLKYILPGYLKESERDATEATTLRLDSLRMAFERNSEYLANIMAVADTSRPAEQWHDTVMPASAYAGVSVGRGKEEERFVAELRDNEKYALSVIAPLAAEDMMFFPVSEEAVVTSGSSGGGPARLAMAPESTVASIADGTVVAVYYSPSDNGYSVIIQHARGFLSRYARLATPLVGAGDRVPGGQIIALTDRYSGKRNNYITVELWQNGIPLLAADYLDPLMTDNRQKLTRRGDGSNSSAAWNNIQSK